MQKKSSRQRALAKIHIAIKDLGISDSQYRFALRLNYGAESAADLTEVQMNELIALFKEKGWKEVPPKKRRPGQPTTNNMHPQMRKIEALLAEAKLPWNYAHAIGKRMFRRDRLEWLTPKQLTAVITALTKRRR